MPTPDRTPEPAPEPEQSEQAQQPEQPEPSEPLTEDDLAQVAEPAVLRRAPKFGAFLVAGGLVGLVAGVVVALATSADSPIVSTGDGFLPFLDGQGAVRTVLGITGAVVGVALGGLVAILADRRSVRRASRA
ncbi:histidine kinase [Cellulomonas soli]